jgi:NADPH-dependent 2,4-dienoyl-CoA reductase/sulfur reductase-like enzyme
MKRIVIVGASLAGVRAAETLRSAGYQDTITIIGEEPSMPYDRPPLSKKFLAGEWEADRIMLRKAADFDALAVEWRLGERATALDVSKSTITVGAGEKLSYDGLIIATGGTVRRLPFQRDMAGVHCLRTVADAVALRDELVEGARVIVIGAGFIGLEAAATASQRGAKVTVLEGLPAPLIRALGEQMGRAVGDVHVRHGVQVRCGARIEGIEGTDRVTGVRLDGGEIVPADVVVVGIGVAPATEWCDDSGLTIRDGIVCDENLCAGPPTVFAAGDVARWPNRLFSDVEVDMRVEHWTNAAEQGAVAARNLVARINGDDLESYAAVPFFWSDQFDARVQCLGRPSSGAVVDVVAGDTQSGRWCAVYSVNDVVTAVLGVTMPKLVMPARSLVAGRVSRSDALAHFERVVTQTST